MMLESMMVAERSEFLRTLPSNKGNVYRPGHGYGHGCKLEFCIPRDRYANFHPQILAILHDRVAEWLNRGLDSYYPVLFVDCVHIKIHRKGSVSSEAFYLALAVTEEGRRDILEILICLQKVRQAEILSLRRSRAVVCNVWDWWWPMVLSALTPLSGNVSQKRNSPAALCHTHLKRNMFARETWR
jgi:transposase-like protein